MLTVWLLPGLDGTGGLFEGLLAVAPPDFDMQVVSYPADEVLDYDALVELALSQAPRRGRWAIVAESFSGPIALRVAAAAPVAPIAVVLAASFVSAPVAPLLGRIAAVVAPLLFRLSPPSFALRLMLVGRDAAPDLVADVRNAIRRVGPAVLSNRLRAVIGVEATEALIACAAPVLYLHATKDRLLRRGIPEQLQRLRPDVEVACLDTAHLILQREPALAIGLIEPFFRAHWQT